MISDDESNNTIKIVITHLLCVTAISRRWRMSAQGRSPRADIRTPEGNGGNTQQVRISLFSPTENDGSTTSTHAKRNNVIIDGFFSLPLYSAYTKQDTDVFSNPLINSGGEKKKKYDDFMVVARGAPTSGC